MLALSPSSLFDSSRRHERQQHALEAFYAAVRRFFSGCQPLRFLSADGGHRFLPPPITCDTIHFPSERFQIVVYFLDEFGRDLAVLGCCFLNPVHQLNQVFVEVKERARIPFRLAAQLNAERVEHICQTRSCAFRQLSLGGLPLGLLKKTVEAPADVEQRLRVRGTNGNWHGHHSPPALLSF